VKEAAIPEGGPPFPFFFVLLFRPPQREKDTEGASRKLSGTSPFFPPSLSLPPLCAPLQIGRR